MNRIYIYGASGHGLVVADIAKACGYDNIKFIDDAKDNYISFDEIKNNDIPIAFGIGDNKTRRKLFEKVINGGFSVATLIHPSAVISSNVKVGKAAVIMPNVVVNANSEIGDGVILNTASVIEHENIIENFVHISPNVALAGNVTVKENVHVGISSTVIQNIKIGKNSIIGAGSVVLEDVLESKICYGNPCRVVKGIDE